MTSLHVNGPRPTDPKQDDQSQAGVPVFHPDYERVWVDATPALLGDEIADMVDTFLQQFENPVNSLPVDGGEYVWLVECWETSNAVMQIFEDLEDSVFEALCDGLDQISTEWVRPDFGQSA